MELGNPEEISGEMLDLAGFIVFGEFLLVIIKAGSEPALSVFVHFMSTNLKFNNLFVFGDDGGVQGLVAVLFRHSNIIFDATAHRHVKRVNDAEGEITISNIIDDDAKCGKIVNFPHVLVVFGELFVEGIDGFDTARNLEFDFFATKCFGNFFLDFLHGFFGGKIVFFDNVGELMIAFGIDIGKSDISHFYAQASHVETVSKGSKNFKGFFSNFLLLVWRKGGKSAEIVEAVGELNDEDADIRTGSDE